MMDEQRDSDSDHAARSGLVSNGLKLRADVPAYKDCSNQIDIRGKECEACGSVLKPSLGQAIDVSTDPVEDNFLAQCTTLERYIISRSGLGLESSHYAGAEEEYKDHITNTDDSCSSSASDDSSHDGSFGDSDYDDSPDPTPITEHATKCRSLERMILGLPGGEQWLGERSGHRKRCGTSRGSTTAPGSSLTSLEDPGSDWANDKHDGDESFSTSTSENHESDNDSLSSMSDQNDNDGDDSSESQDEGGERCEKKNNVCVEREQLLRSDLLPATTSSEHASECRSLERMISNLTDERTSSDGDKESESSDSEDLSENQKVKDWEKVGNDFLPTNSSDSISASISEFELSHGVGEVDGEPSETASRSDSEVVANEAAGKVVQAVHSNGVLSQLADHLLSLVFGFVIEISDGTEDERESRFQRAIDVNGGAKSYAKSEAVQFSWAPYNTAAMTQHAALIAPLRVVSKGFRDALAQGCALRLSITQGKLMVAADDCLEMNFSVESRRYPGFLQPGLTALKVVPPETHPKQWTRDDASHEQEEVAGALRVLLAPVWPMLRVLDLSFVNLEAALISVQVANLCPKLEALSVSHCEAVDDATIVALAHGKCAGNLRALNVTSCCYDGIGDAAVAILAERCPKLASLRIGYAGALTDAGITALACRQLTCQEPVSPLVEFCAPYCERVTDVGLLLLTGQDISEVESGLNAAPVELDRQGRDYSVQGRAMAAARRAAEVAGAAAGVAAGGASDTYTTSGKAASELSSSASFDCNAVSTAIVCPMCTVINEGPIEACHVCCSPLPRARIEMVPPMRSNQPPLLGTRHYPMGRQMSAAVRRLRMFDVSSCPNVGTQGVVAVVECAGPWLQYLDLGGCDGVDAATCCAALAACPSLRVFRLTDWYSLSDNALLEAAHHCPQLEALDVAFTLVPSPVVSSAALAQLPSLLPRLVSLNLSYLENVNDAVVAAIASGCPRLRELRLAYCIQITDVGLRAISSHLGGSLQVLSLHSDDLCTDAGLVAVCKGCPLLAELDAAFLRFLTDVVVDVILLHCARLVKLALHGCLQITKKARARVQQVWDEQAAAARSGGEYVSSDGDLAAAFDRSDKSSDEYGSGSGSDDDDGC